MSSGFENKVPREIKHNIMNYLPPHEEHAFNLQRQIESYRARNPLQESLLGPEEIFRNDIEKNSNWKIIDQIVTMNVKTLPSNLANTVIMGLDSFGSSASSNVSDNSKEETISAIKLYFSFLVNDLLPMDRAVNRNLSLMAAVDILKDEMVNLIRIKDPDGSYFTERDIKNILSVIDRDQISDSGSDSGIDSGSDAGSEGSGSTAFYSARTAPSFSSSRNISIDDVSIDPDETVFGMPTHPSILREEAPKPKSILGRFCDGLGRCFTRKNGNNVSFEPRSEDIMGGKRTRKNREKKQRHKKKNLTRKSKKIKKSKKTKKTKKHMLVLSKGGATTRTANNTKAKKSKKAKKTTKIMKSNTGKQMKKLSCSPEGNEKSFTCISDESLEKLRVLWNRRHSDDMIEKSSDSKETWEALKNKMQHTCDRESCWLKQGFSEKEMTGELKKAFAPEAPNKWKTNPNEWLSSTDIIAVMKQYEKRYKCFNFIGPSPIDYDFHKMYGECVWDELCNFNLSDEINKKKNKKIGIIFNTDPHYKGGAHWVSLFINIPKKSVFYFDSVGKKPKPQIQKFMEKVKLQGKKLNPPIDFKLDSSYPNEHQMKDTECGVYSLYFITALLEDKHDEQWFKNNKISDREMSKFRKVFFNESL